ncbi:MAG: 3-dehydroquinate synthase, partial [Muribaculaceae bacterium]|nr:3-dehydroquinate synthase [Muribaculaceae bacterium]
AVDAATGGKTGINFDGLKNQIGAFAEPEAAVISTIFFNTLPGQQILSGYAEMLKHGLLDDAATLGRLLAFTPTYPLTDTGGLMPLLKDSVMVKANIVSQDLTESGLRKALNLGHTAGHAFETFALRRHNHIAHGYAVAWGLVTELVLSHMLQGFPSAQVHSFASYVKENYGAFPITCDDYPELVAAMRQDKKNASPDSINFTLLRDVGDPVLDVVASPEQITAALDLYRDLMGLA